MGVVNVTPDSFSDGGRWFDHAAAIAHGMDLFAARATVIDVGGESTRPGADPVDSTEEQRRVLPVIEALASKANVPISVDTYKASIAKVALDSGAAMVNDISGLRYEPDLAQVVAKSRAPIILMHTRGRSKDMYKQAVYSEVVDEVLGAVNVQFRLGEKRRAGSVTLRIEDGKVRSVHTLANCGGESDCGRHSGVRAAARLHYSQRV